MRAFSPRGSSSLVILLGLLSVGWALASSPSQAVSDGGTLRVSNVPMGAYRVNVFTDPTPVPPDTIDVSILVTFERGRGVARGLDILVLAKPLEDLGEERSEPVTREQAEDPRFYAAKFALGVIGPWELTVRVEGPEGEGEVSFIIEVREPGWFGNPWAVLTVALLPLVLVGWWLRRSSGGAAPSAPDRNGPV